jgi:methionyl aminopeptidase
MSKVTIKSHNEVELMRESCKIVAEVLKLIKSYISPGITTLELDRIAEEYIRSRGAEPAFKGYGADKSNLFPSSLCTSIDDEVVHGVPCDRKLVEGEILSIDVGVKKNQYYGDGAWTFEIGKVCEDKKRLMDVTEQALYKGIEQARAGNRVHDISASVQTHVERAGYTVVRDLVGHGIGKQLHEEPAVPNFGVARTGVLLKKGMTLAIEPMINMGDYQVYVNKDGWTVKTLDEKPSAHFEHTILVTENEPEILTI